MEYNRKKQEEVHLQELKGSLAESITADPPLPVPESIRIVQDAKKEWQLPDTEIIKVPASAPPAQKPLAGTKEHLRFSDLGSISRPRSVLCAAHTTREAVARTSVRAWIKL